MHNHNQDRYLKSEITVRYFASLQNEKKSFKREKFPAIEHDIDRVSKGKAFEAKVINIISNEIKICGSQGQAIKRGYKE